MAEGDADAKSSSADEKSNIGLVRELLMSLLPIVSVLVGCVIGWYTCTRAVQTFRDVFEVPELSPLPVQDRAPGVPGPTASYCLSWAVPIGTVYGVGALLIWRWRRGRVHTGALIAGFSVAILFLVPTWVSIEVGGFAPT